MILLIDYDNLPRSLRRANLRQIIERLIDKLIPSTPVSVNRIHCRLYGGWMNKKRFSRKAEQLFKEIDRHFPLAYSSSKHLGIIVKAELARALVCDPQKVFTHTFRTRSKPAFRVKRFPLKECVEPQGCRIMDVNSFVYNDVCPNMNCNVSPETAFYRTEQKLVDSMIVVDLVHYAINQDEHLVVVSGDDDMWPGLRYALLQNAKVTHIIPRTNGRRESPYKRLSTKSYTLVTL